MSRSLRNRIRRKERMAEAVRYEATLSKPRNDNSLDMEKVFSSIVCDRLNYVLRSPTTWSANMKSKDKGKVTLSVAKHVFARYPTPAHLDAVWYEIAEPPPFRHGRIIPAKSLSSQRADWWLTVAQGGSLHKVHTKEFFTKKETHEFLVAPKGLTFLEAVWYAIAGSYTSDHGLRHRIAKSKIGQLDVVTPFWKDAVRFFCANPVPINELNDLYDYLDAKLIEARQEHKEYTLKGRTLDSLRKAMVQWHHDLARVKKIGGGKWDGLPIPDWEYEENPHSAPHERVTWKMVQLKTGKDLAEEGNKQRHCVYSYKSRCISGSCAIFGLRIFKHRTGLDRVLTIEVNAHRCEIVQVRGIANRAATPHERSIVRRWAQEMGLGIATYAC